MKDRIDVEELRHILLDASNEEVGPACMKVVVPPTIDMSDSFREAYCQGYRHALWDVRRVTRGAEA